MDEKLVFASEAMSKVVILGAGGMLGQALTEVWSDQEVVAWDREQLDVTDVQAVREKITAEKPAWILNAAAYTNVDGAETDQEAALAVNEIGVRNIAQVARELEISLVHYSTDYVFPGDKAEGYQENDMPGPAVNAYGESKLAGEKALATVGGEYFLVRTAWLYGAGGRNFVETMLKLADSQNEIKVVNDQHGSPTYTVDLARYTKELVQAGYKPGIYHGVNQGMTTWYGFAQKIFELANKQVKVVPIKAVEYPRPAQRPEWSVLINDRGPNMRTWEEALSDYLRNRKAET